MASLDGAQQLWQWPEKDGEPGRLKRFFGGMPAVNVTTAMLNKYIDKCLEERLGTINRDLAMLKKMFSLAMNQTPPLIQRAPKFPEKLLEPAARDGFVEDQQYAKLAEGCQGKL